MKPIILPAFILALIAAPAFAENPHNSGKEKHAAEQAEQGHDAMQETTYEMDKQAGKEAHDMDDEAEDMAHESDESMEKMEKAEKEKMKGHDKQAEKKAGREMKELDKGSEQGQEARQEHSKKWWKFWE